MKQVVGKRINKKRYLYPLPVSCPVESHGRVDGLYTLRSSHEEDFTRRCRDRCCGILTFLNLSKNHYLNSAEYTFLFITTNGQASTDTDTRRDTVRDQMQFQQVFNDYI